MTSHRNPIFVEDAEVIEHQAFPAAQYMLRLQAPQCAAAARPGQFVHLQCDPQLPLRRPLSVLRAERDSGRIDVLYKVVGMGTALLSQRRPGETVSLLGPVGNGFTLDPGRPLKLLLGGGVGMPPMIFLADRLRSASDLKAFVILGSEVPFPFHPRPSRFHFAGLPEAVTAAMPLLEDWGVPSRLTSLQGYPGCFEGYVTEFAAAWLDRLEADARAGVEVFACGQEPMLEAVKAMVSRYALPCQLSLEEYMACGVGGCAGCVVEVQTAAGPVMRRVCVDGPVFSAQELSS